GISSTHSVRITGTNGNPIFFGAMLVLLIPVTLGVIFAEHQKSTSENKRWWLAALAIVSFVIAVSLISVVSRGPWVGAAASGLVGIVLLIKYRRIRVNKFPLAVLVIFAIVGSLIWTFDDLILPEKHDSVASGAGSESAVFNSALSGVGRTNTMDLRLRYWRLSRTMSIDRDPVPYTNDAPKAVRWLFGYGPDMFRFAGTYFSDNTTFTRRLTAAHNDPINRLVEQGALGLIAWLSLWASIAYGGMTLVRRLGSRQGEAMWWIGIAIVAALFGRFIEQLFGSPTPGGVLIFWVLAGGLAALLVQAGTTSSARTVPITNPRVPQLAIYAGLAVILIGSITLAWDRGANYLIADQMASFLYRETSVTGDEAIVRLEQAARLAPDVPRYWHDLADIEHGRAEATENPVRKAEALSSAYEYDLKGYEANKMETSSIYRLAFSAWEAGNAGRPELRQEALDLYTRLTVIIPSDNLARERHEILQNLLNP
ncbi:MAG: O-antigen ligase family protein, partial [Chloroflexi bacterium]|nr:O-antigen ligase family protein [Chloroflexota bacterium]